MLGDHGVPLYVYASWNYLDLMVLAVSWIDMFVPPEGPLKVLRLARAFRPLRMVNCIDGMKLVIMSLVAAGLALANVMAFLIFCSVPHLWHSWAQPIYGQVPELQWCNG